MAGTPGTQVLRYLTDHLPNAAETVRLAEENPLIVEDVNGIRHVILNRPHKLNAIDLAQHGRLLDIFRDTGRDASIRVLALSGRGRAFCSGDDLTQSSTPQSDPLKGRRVDLEVGAGPTLLLESCAELRRLPIPTVALMHGVALGSGYDYSLSCDFRFATKNLRYGDPRIHRALWAAEGWSYKLPRLMCQSVVTKIAYLGLEMTGREAQNIGLVHQIVDEEPSIRQCASPYLQRIQSLAGAAYASTKVALLFGLDESFEHSQLRSRLPL